MVNDIGKVMAPVKPEQPSNALTPIVVNKTSPSKLTDVILEQEWKALDPMVVKLVGKVMAPVKPEL